MDDGITPKKVRKKLIDWPKIWDSYQKTRFFHQMLHEKNDYKFTFTEIHKMNDRLGYGMNTKFQKIYEGELRALSKAGLLPFAVNHLVQGLYYALRSQSSCPKVSKRFYSKTLNQLQSNLSDFKIIIRDYGDFHGRVWTCSQDEKYIHPEELVCRLQKILSILINPKKVINPIDRLYTPPMRSKPGQKEDGMISNETFWLFLYLRCAGELTSVETQNRIRKLLSCFAQDDTYRQNFNFKQTAERYARRHKQ